VKQIQRFAIQYVPPTLFVEYKVDLSTFVKRIRIKLPNIASTSTDFIEVGARRLLSTFPDLFGESDIYFAQLCDIFKLLIRKQANEVDTKPNNTNDALKEILEIDLNKCSNDLNLKAKKLMDLEFESKRLKPGDPGYQWDIRADFESPSEKAEWDDDDED